MNLRSVSHRSANPPSRGNVRRTRRQRKRHGGGEDDPINTIGWPATTHSLAYPAATLSTPADATNRSKTLKKKIKETEEAERMQTPKTVNAIKVMLDQEYPVLGRREEPSEQPLVDKALREMREGEALVMKRRGYQGELSALQTGHHTYSPEATATLAPSRPQSAPIAPSRPQSAPIAPSRPQSAPGKKPLFKRILSVLAPPQPWGSPYPNGGRRTRMRKKHRKRTRKKSQPKSRKRRSTRRGRRGSTRL